MTVRIGGLAVSLEGRESSDCKGRTEHSRCVSLGPREIFANKGRIRLVWTFWNDSGWERSGQRQVRGKL